MFYFWEADATEKGSLGPKTVVNSNQKACRCGGCDAREINNCLWVNPRDKQHGDECVARKGVVPQVISMLPEHMIEYVENGDEK